MSHKATSVDEWPQNLLFVLMSFGAYLHSFQYRAIDVTSIITKKNEMVNVQANEHSNKNIGVYTQIDTKLAYHPVSLFVRDGTCLLVTQS